jgi:signal recognition particle receptor subunit beta
MAKPLRSNLISSAVAIGASISTFVKDHWFASTFALTFVQLTTIAMITNKASIKDKTAVALFVGASAVCSVIGIGICYSAKIIVSGIIGSGRKTINPPTDTEPTDNSNESSDSFDE